MEYGWDINFSVMGPDFLQRLRQALLAPEPHKEIMLRELHALHRPDINFYEWIIAAEDMARLIIAPNEQQY